MRHPLIERLKDEQEDVVLQLVEKQKKNDLITVEEGRYLELIGDARALAEIAAELVAQYRAMPDGELGKGLTNGPFLELEKILNRGAIG